MLTRCSDEKVIIFLVPLQASIPFSVIGSNTIVEVNGRRVRGRLYPWGIVEGTLGAYTLIIELLFLDEHKIRS